MKKKFLKTNEAARYLGVSRSSLTNWVKQGTLGGGATPGGHYRFTVEELNSFAEKRGLKIHKRDEDTPVKILVIEDDKAFREFVKDSLDIFSGFELKEAGDGMQGALLIGTWRPDLVILDIRMPNMNGLEFCRMLKEDENTTNVKVIVASAFLSPEVRAEISELGVDIVLEKPIRLGTLVAAVQQLANLRLK